VAHLRAERVCEVLGWGAASRCKRARVRQQLVTGPHAPSDNGSKRIKQKRLLSACNRFIC
jgi:hypothetical protein